MDYNYRLERVCPFSHKDTPTWAWCGRPCWCRPFIIDDAARAHALTPGVPKAPVYPFDIMPGDRQPGFEPFPGYGEFKRPPWYKAPDPKRKAQAEEVAKQLPNVGFGLKALTHKPKPKPRSVDPKDTVEDAEIVQEPLITPPPVSNSQSNTEANTPPVRLPEDTSVRPQSNKPFDKKAYQRDLMRKRREARRRENDSAQKDG